MAKLNTGFEELLQKVPAGAAEKDAYIAELQSAVRDLVGELHNLDEVIALLRKKQFGSSSEQTPLVEQTEEQMVLNEPEAVQDAEEPEPIKIDKYGRHIRKTDGKWKLANLPVEEVVLDMAPEALYCENCGSKMVKIGQETIRENIQYIPAQLKVLRYVRPVYGCPKCHEDIVKARAPKPLLNHSMASASSVAHILYQKYCNGMPLYRQEQEWADLGIALTRTTMANWVIRCAEDWLEPVVQRLHAELLQREVLHCDETPVQVLKEPGKTATSKSYMWLYRTGQDDPKPVVLYDYQPSRSGSCAVQYLAGFSGYLHTDGYAGYNQVNGVTRCGCWAHLRRKFVEAMPSGTSSMPTSAEIGRNYCDQLFATEKKLAGLSPEERKVKRLELEKPQLQAFWCWLNTVNVSNGFALKKAVQYALDQKPNLEHYLLDGRCQISNNLAENAIRPFTIGRKNWLFCDTQAGAKASAAVYSLIETAKANGWNPRKYLYMLLSEMPRMDLGQHPEEMDELMPWDAESKRIFKRLR